MIEIDVLDEINCTIDGLAAHELRDLIDSLKFKESGAFMTSAYKLGMWDGYTSMIDDDGSFFFYHINHVMDFLTERGYSEEEIEIEDHRDPLPFPSQIPIVDSDFLLDELGYTLRPHQLQAINSTIMYHTGILDLATNAGKTAICIGISKVFDPYIKIIVVVPTNLLVKQTFEDYKKAPYLKSTSITSSDSKKQRLKKLKDYNHIVMTTKLFQNLIEEICEQRFGIIVDEAHIFGEVMEHNMRYEANHFPLRMGLTGTVPTDPLKREKLKSHLGGDIIGKIRPSELIEKGYASVPYIHDVVVSDREINELFKELKSQGSGDDCPFDWSVEISYLNDNKNRITVIANYLRTIHLHDPKNTLILCHAGFSRNLSEEMGIPYIAEEVKDREEQLANFVEGGSHQQIASFDTSSTGISIDSILRVVLIDAGKNDTRIFQSIGRGLRLDGVHNEVEIIDISSDTIYSKRHRTERKKMYRVEKFETVSKKVLEV